jgi:transcriptional regulator with XRE-family HTH domain
MLKDGDKYPLTSDPDAFPGRLREALESYGSASKAADAIGRSEGAVRKWLHGKSQPNVSDLRAICEITGVNVEWLVTGHGNKHGIPGADSPAAPVYVPPAAITYRLLAEAAVAVKLEARIAGKPFTPEKCSDILATVYNASVAAQHVEQETADRVVGLAT